MPRETVISRRIAERLESLNKQAMPHAISDECKAKLIELVQHGATLTEIETLRGMPRANYVWQECKRDPAFGQALQEARVIAAANVLEEAQHHLRDAVESNDPDVMRIASDYARASTAYAEKIAPKEFGQLVKHAGADGGALTVNVVQYAIEAPAVIGGTLQDESALTHATPAPLDSESAT